MAVKDDDVYHPTESLILRQPRSHYRTTVAPTHWQLRSLLGSEKNHLVYFPSGANNTHINCLNTITHECITIKRLSFEPRCLVVKNGWLCCGGETGEFSAILLDSVHEDSTEADVIETLFSRQNTQPSTEDSLREHIYSHSYMPPNTAQSFTFGKERVNCVTIWVPPILVSRFEDAYDGTVAVLANNDKTVFMVSLPNGETLDEVVFSDCVNRALLSPDGQYLIAICDDPYLYIYQRMRSTAGPSGRSAWKEAKKLHLKGQIVGDRSNNRGSFAVCFSSSGRWLAVGTQYGRILVFDMWRLAEAGADIQVASFKSSRCDLEIGAVREMAFAPGPIDLLAWTEDRGHIGVADVRNGFTSRQILQLEDEDNYNHIEIVTKTRTESANSFIDPRLLDGTRTDSNSAANSTRPRPISALSAALDLTVDPLGESSRSLLDRTLDELNNPATSLTAEETRVLAQLQAHRQRREQRQQNRILTHRWPFGQATANSAEDQRWYNLYVSMMAARRADAEERRAGEADTVPGRARASLHGSDTARTTPLRNVRDILGTVRDQLRTTEERLQGLQASIRDSHDVEIANRTEASDDPAVTQWSPIARLLAAGAAPRPASTTGGAAGRLELADFLSDINSDTLSSTTQRDPNRFTMAPDEVRRRTMFMQRIRGETARNTYPTTRYAPMLRERSDPHDTAGLSWSDDGRTLFIGAVNGIYEFKVNMIHRRTFPSVNLS